MARGPNGRGLCRWCSEEVPKGRLTFCSDEHVHEWRLRSDPGYLRTAIWKRDKGVCAACGLDTEDLKRQVAEIKDVEQKALLLQHGFGRRAAHYWEADHIVPVIEGGGETGPENIRTLCLPCHWKATGELRSRLNLAQRQKKDQEKLRRWVEGVPVRVGGVGYDPLLHALQAALPKG